MSKKTKDRMNILMLGTPVKQLVKRYSSKLNENLRGKGLMFTLKIIRNKIQRVIYIRLKRILTLDKRSLNHWKDLKGKYSGKRVFLVGNGPSLNKTKLYLLANEHTICFNRFNIMFERLSWKPTFYMNIDPLVAEDMAKEINEIVPHVKLAFFPDIHTNGLDFRKFVNNAQNVQWMFPQHQNFYFDLPNVALGGTVAYAALQVLTFLGFSEIYLIGVDMNYQIHTTVKDINNTETDVKSTKDDDPNHFDPRYFGTNRKYHQPVPKTINKMMGSFQFAADKIKQHTNTKVFNAGIGSKVESFEKVNFDDLFNYSEEEAFLLFTKPFEKILKFKNFDEILAQIPEIKSSAEITPDTNYFLCELEIAPNLIKELVYSFVSFGPYRNKVLFISRKKLGEN